LWYARPMNMPSSPGLSLMYVMPRSAGQIGSPQAAQGISGLVASMPATLTTRPAGIADAHFFQRPGRTRTCDLRIRRTSRTPGLGYVEPNPAFSVAQLRADIGGSVYARVHAHSSASSRKAGPDAREPQRT
jgi:hypothetical protein